MVPREYDMVMRGLREYREEEQRATQKAISLAGGKSSQGGQTIRNA